MMRLPVFLSLLAASSAVLAQTEGGTPATADFDTDKRFATPVTLRLKMVPLSEAIQALSKASGVAMESAQSLRDLKVTVLVKDQSAGSVAKEIANTLDLVWETDKDALRLKTDPDVARIERQFLEAEDVQRRSAIQAFLRKFVDLAGQSYEAAKEKDAQISPERYLLGQSLRQLNASGWTGFWNGQTLRAAVPYTEPSPGGGVGARNRTRRIVRVFARFDPISSRLVTSLDVAAQGITTSLIDQPTPTGKLAETAYGKRILEWSKRDDPADPLKKPVTGTPTSDWFGGKFATSDVLEVLHNATGIPIVADAYRVGAESRFRAQTGADWLAQFQRQNKAFVRTEAGYLLVRHGGFWRLRRFDVTERQARPLEAKPMPSVTAYAAFANGLSLPQVAACQLADGVLFKVDPTPLRRSMPALRFLGSLGGQQAPALAGRAITFAEMSATSQALFLDALDGWVSGATSLGPGLDLSLDDTVANLGFLATAEEQTVYDPTTQTPVLRSGLRFLFGVSPTRGTAYSIAVAPKPG